ncbi:MAG: phage terminase large subunit family protein [Deltaproteobacteria bacterium]|nr:phage terminase large subunit family protein [Deltaproteobacteria bacterium]
MPEAGQGAMFQTLTWTRAERAILARPGELDTARWAEKNLRVVDGPYKGSAWRIAAAPYVPGMLRVIEEPWVRLAVIIAASQVGKTWGVIYAHWAHKAVIDPAPALLMMADYNSARKVALNRLHPMVDQSDALAALKSPAKEDNTGTRIKLLNGAVLDLGWSGSVSTASTFSYKLVYLDELNLYDAELGQEADAVSLAQARTAQYPNDSKIIAPTTVTYETAPGWRAYKEKPEEYFDFHVPCPHCGESRVLEFAGIRWPEGENDGKLIKRKRLAWYECPACGGRWSDQDRNQAILAGEWRPRLGVERPAAVGFHLPAWCSPQVTFSQCAAAFLARETSRGAAKYFANHIKAEPFTDEKVERNWEDLLARAKAADHGRGQVPEGVRALVAAVDVQRRGFYLCIWGVGAAPELNLWLVLETYLSEFADVAQVALESRFPGQAGGEHQVNFGLMDSGDGERTQEVYDWCRAHKPIFPFKGVYRGATLWKASHLEAFPDGRRIPGGLKLYTANVNLAKHDLSRRLAIAPGLPGSLNFHQDIEEGFARQLSSEYVNDQGGWECRSGVANHYWDCAVYGLVAAKILEPLLMPRAGDNAGPPANEPPAPPRENPTQRPGWYEERRY